MVGFHPYHEGLAPDPTLFQRKFLKREWLWYQVNWSDGRQDRPQEDYGPGWFSVAELEQGRFDYDDVNGLEFDAKPVKGPQPDTLWERLGPPK